MDEGLAFCMDQFIDEQMVLMDERVEEINKKEAVECSRIEKAKREADKKKPPPKDKGSHDQDKALVDRLTRDLSDKANDKGSRTVIDDPATVDALRAETLTKIGACSTYLARLRNLAQPLPNTRSFVQSCNETIEICRRTDYFEESFRQLCTILAESGNDDFVRNTQRWWKSAYGDRIADLNRRNQKINAAITEDNFAVVSPTSRIVANARTLLGARQIVVAEAPKVEIIRQFVHRHLSLDQELQKRTNPDTLIEELNAGDNAKAIGYAQQWLRKRDEIRDEKEEQDPYEMELDAAKAEYGRQRIAQEAKKLALAALLCRLAVGSDNNDGFDKKLKKTVQKQNQNNGESLAVISGDIKDPGNEELPLIIQLRMDEGDMTRWAGNSGNLRERFAAALCKAFGIPEKQIRVDDVELDKGVIHLIVRPPYGKNVVDSLNGNAKDAAVRMAAVRICCLELDAHVESITLGEFGLQVENRLMDPRWNKKYVQPEEKEENTHYWATPIDQGGKPYFCPSGWRRYGVKVAEDAPEFDSKWGQWHVAYHGTRGQHASNILTSGLRVSTTGCFYEEGTPRVYVSPSIEYSAHPRYAFPWRQAKKNGKDIWYQLVFQCRVNPTSIDKIGPETLLFNEKKPVVQVDPNFTNQELEWVILGKKNIQFVKDDIICYGLMVRSSLTDPATLPSSHWWPFAHHSFVYKQPQ